MKNQIIKKIMAYLLVGAMVISTPITASASELENAYKTGTDSDTGISSGSNTDTDTNTGTKAVEPVPIPEIIQQYDLNIVGIVLDKDSLSFNEVNLEEALQARVLFDDYDPAEEEMEWASLGSDTRKLIEEQIHWYSYDNEVAKIDGTGSSKAVVKSQGAGETKVCAWIEADGKAYSNNPDCPTSGDYIAEAVVTVTEKITSIEFIQEPEHFFEKRTYDLKDSTWLVTSAGTKIRATDAEAEKLVYSLDGTIPKGSTITLSEDGILTVKKASSATTGVKFNVIATASRKADDPDKFVMAESQSIQFGDAIHATSISLKKDGDVTKSETLDLGDVDNTSVVVTATLQYKKGKNVEYEVTADDGQNREDGSTITDVVTWTSKKSSIADIEDVEGKDDLTKRIVAKGVGSTTITATTSSGKKANIKVTVDATPTGVKIVDINEEESGKTYTGKQTTLTAVLTAKDKDGNEIELPLGNTKLKWSTEDKKIAGVSGKKEIGIVKPVNGLETKGNTAGAKKEVTIKVVGTGKNAKKVSYNVTGGYNLTVEQSDISNVDVYKFINGEWSDDAIVPNSAKTANDTAYIGTNSMYTAVPVQGSYPEGAESSNAIGWSISGSAAAIDDNGSLTPVKAGSSTVTASYVTLDANGKAKLNKKTVKVKVIQNATSIAFAKEETVKNPSAKAQKVTLKVKSIEPKKATCNVVTWKTLGYIVNENGTVDMDSVADTATDTAKLSVKPKETGKYITKCTNTSVTVAIPAGAQAGSVIKVGAYTNGGVVAYAYIYVTKKTTKVRVDDALGSVSLGQTASIGNVKVELGKDENKQPIDDDAAKPYEAFNESGNTTAYETEPVTYSVDKTSAKYISVDQYGNVTGLQKTPEKKTATVTIKTVSGKTAKVKVKVN